MREIKFRVWYPIEWDDEKPIKFDISYDWAFEEWAPINDLFNNSMPDGSILMQFTGLFDKNGKEIYEGDLLIFDERRAICSVEFKDGMFLAKTPFKNYWRIYNKTLHYKQPEIIGNIYENPELL